MILESELHQLFLLAEAVFLSFMSLTRALIAAAGTSLILVTADPMALGLAVLGSQLPDIDTTTSTIGKIFGSTHSLLATGFIAAIALPIGYLLGNWLTAIAATSPNLQQ